MSREEVEKLRASRAGQKSWITRSKKYTEDAYNGYNTTTKPEPLLVEKYLEKYEEHFEKYTKLEEEIEIHPHSDPNDLDKDVDDIIKDFFDMAIQNKKEGDIMATGTKKSEYQRRKYSTDDPNPDAHQDQEEDKIPMYWCDACKRHHPKPYCRRKR